MFISGCNTSESNVKIPPAKIKTSDTQPREYLSITNTEYVNGTDANEGMIINVYTYDLQDKTLNKLTNLSYNSQYPLTVVSLANDTTYYSGADKNKGGQLFAYDMRTDEIETVFLQKEGFINNFTLISEPDEK
ncbi:MAG: hypothetical protein IKE29_06435 [Paenibacillus sp.]|uniref:hypothetical protein n=1 Tax=Paenibacillus sp. TaxID=58172 RepID=UPI0025D1F4AC|nr:hypothetical protein [Paenibacillus sp.]MBR2564243.1 hypothetical protein [Paenibacillus sp.]